MTVVAVRKRSPLPLGCWKTKSVPDQSYFSARGHAGHTVALKGIMGLEERSKRGCILEKDAQNGQATVEF